MEKIIISINIKKLQRDNMGVELWWLLTMPHVSNIEEVFSEEEFLGCEVLRLGQYGL